MLPQPAITHGRQTFLDPSKTFQAFDEPWLISRTGTAKLGSYALFGIYVAGKAGTESSYLQSRCQCPYFDETNCAIANLRLQPRREMSQRHMEPYMTLTGTSPSSPSLQDPAKQDQVFSTVWVCNKWDVMASRYGSARRHPRLDVHLPLGDINISSCLVFAHRRQFACHIAEGLREAPEQRVCYQERGSFGRFRPSPLRSDPPVLLNQGPL